MVDRSNQIRKQLPPSPLVMTTGVILALTGWIGLGLIVLLTKPTLGPRWLMFFLVTLAFSGTALPVVRYLHHRFPGRPAATASVLVREALWVGVYADVLLWLQFGRVLNFALGFFIAAGLVAIEVLLRLRERNKWAPPVES